MSPSIPLADQITTYQTRMSQALHALNTGTASAEADALVLLKDYRQWLKALPEAEAAEAALETAVEALKSALTRQCRL